jgi:hypothetical protein
MSLDSRQMLGENCLGNLAALNSRFGSEAIDRLVHVEPAAVMATIDRVLGDLTLDQLRGIRDGRRHIVWAIEKLAFRAPTFGAQPRSCGGWVPPKPKSGLGITPAASFCTSINFISAVRRSAPKNAFGFSMRGCNQTPGTSASCAWKRSARCSRRAISLAWAVAKKSAASG